VPAHLEDCWDEPDASAVRGDLEALQGAWQSIAGRREAAFLVSGDHFTVHFADGDIYMGRFTIDPSAWPKRMEICIVEGPAHHRGMSALCIYELDGDKLNWCTAGPGQSQRPMSFPGEDDPRFLCVLFQREKARGRRG
jgi:uncharacterized protein (TIGR03067 family)